MTSRKRGGWTTGGLVFLCVLLVIPALALAQDPGEPPKDEIDPPWMEEPDEIVPGEETEDGLEFEVPFFAGGISTLVAQFVDCATGEPIDEGGVQTEYYFADGAQPPYGLEDLIRVVVWVPGYQPAAIEAFDVIEMPLLFVTISMIVPAEGSVCLMPAEGDPEPEFVDDEETPSPEVSPDGSPDGEDEEDEPGVCGARESERKVWRVVYHPAGVDVERLTKPNGGLETRFTFHFDRVRHHKVRDRGPCVREADHTGPHRPWDWSAWREDGSETVRVSTSKTIGGWPEGMSASYVQRWVLGFCAIDLSSLGLSHLRYVLGSFDANAYYEAFIKDQLK